MEKFHGKNTSRMKKMIIVVNSFKMNAFLQYMDLFMLCEKTIWHISHFYGITKNTDLYIIFWVMCPEVAFQIVIALLISLACLHNSTKYLISETG